MAGEVRTKMLEKLRKLKITEDSIQTTSQWIIFHEDHVEEVVSTWEEHFQAGVTDRVALLYLANDVMQTRKKSGQFVRRFGQAMPKAFQAATRTNSPSLLKAMRRLASIWEERRVFKPDFCAKLRAAYGPANGSAGASPGKRAAARGTRPGRAVDPRTGARQGSRGEATHTVARMEQELANAKSDPAVAKFRALNMAGLPLQKSKVAAAAASNQLYGLKQRVLSSREVLRAGKKSLTLNIERRDKLLKDLMKRVNDQQNQQRAAKAELKKCDEQMIIIEQSDMQLQDAQADDPGPAAASLLPGSATARMMAGLMGGDSSSPTMGAELARQGSGGFEPNTAMPPVPAAAVPAPAMPASAADLFAKLKKVRQDLGLAAPPDIAAPVAPVPAAAHSTDDSAVGGKAGGGGAEQAAEETSTEPDAKRQRVEGEEVQADQTDAQLQAQALAPGTFTQDATEKMLALIRQANAGAGGDEGAPNPTD